jgi:phage gp36-like protein
VLSRDSNPKIKIMWREVTENDVLGVLNALEHAGYQAAAIASGQNPMQDAITGVVNQCRGYIADNSQNTLAEGVTLPERVILSACHIVRVELLTRLDIEVSKDRESAKRDAIRFFERVADGKVIVEQPGGTETDAMPAPSPKTTARVKKFGRDQQDGI